MYPHLLLVSLRELLNNLSTDLSYLRISNNLVLIHLNLIKMLKNNKQTTSIRSKHFNLRKEDNHLFSNEYKKIIHSSNVRLIKNIYLEKSRLKKYQYFRVHVKEQRMNPITLKTKIKYFFSDLNNLLFNRIKSELLVIDKASWVID